MSDIIFQSSPPFGEMALLKDIPADCGAVLLFGRKGKYGQLVPVGSIHLPHQIYVEKLEVL